MTSHGLAINVTGMSEEVRDKLREQLEGRSYLNFDKLTDPKTGEDFMTVYARIPKAVPSKPEGDELIEYEFDDVDFTIAFNRKQG